MFRLVSSMIAAFMRSKIGIYLLGWAPAVNKISSDRLALTYHVGFQKYVIPIKCRRGPSGVTDIRIIHEDGRREDVTERVREFMGPGQDFHGQSLRPIDLGFDRPLEFYEMMSDKVHVVSPHEHIDLSKLSAR